MITAKPGRVVAWTLLFLGGAVMVLPFFSMLIPAYLVVLLAGWRRMLEVLPAVLTAGVSFALVQLLVSNLVGPELTDIASSLTCIVVMVFVLKLWKPKNIVRLEGDQPASITMHRHTVGQLFLAW